MNCVNPLDTIQAVNTVVLTGASSGVGREVALDLIRRRRHVTMFARAADRVSEVVGFADRVGAPQPRVIVCDLSDHDQVRNACTQAAQGPAVDIVINCAAIGGGVDTSVRETNSNGVELRMAVNAATPHLIARCLASALSPTGRIVQVGSIGQSPVDLDDLNFTSGYEGMTAYCRAKLALIMSAIELAAEGIPVNVVHPAHEMPTRMVAEGGFPSTSTLDDGVLPVLRAALDTKIADVRGAYFDRFDLADPHPQALDSEVRKAVVAWLDEVTQ